MDRWKQGGHSCNWTNTFKVHNQRVLWDALDNRPAGQSLITVSNHYSCGDSPLLCGMADFPRHFFNSRTMGWNLGARDICFTNELHSLFFSLGRTVPIVRGNGVYQKAMDFVLDRLNKGDWLHVYPEGKVNMAKEIIQFKWGIGRLIAECKVCPIVIPLFHMGMDEILPNEPPYYPRFKKKVTVLIGKPMLQLEETIKELQKLNKSARELRSILAQLIQEEVWKLHDEVKALHFSQN
uniref:Tafazzin family protein n=1 Tax=Strigamia maritima TaxID=126957 RepID=T1IHS4_STRMM